MKAEPRPNRSIGRVELREVLWLIHGLSTSQLKTMHHTGPLAYRSLAASIAQAEILRDHMRVYTHTLTHTRLPDDSYVASEWPLIDGHPPLA